MSLGFVAFVESILRVRLTPGQRALARVAFDGAEPGALTGAEREMGRRLFGPIETIPPEARHVVVAVCGARAGKSYVLGALRLLHLALTVPLTTLARGEVAVALIVAPDMRLARQVLRYALGAAESVPAIRNIISARAADGFTLERPDGGKVSIECLPATRGGSAVRGRSLVGAVLDESAFFRDETFTVNDLEVFRAVAPRILAGGQLVIASTPWTEAGLLHEFHKRNFGRPTDAIAVHAATLTLRNDEHTRSYVARERGRDPVNAAREFDAEFMPGGAETFFDGRAVETAVDDALILPRAVSWGAVRGVGADFGFRSDSSALVTVQMGPDGRLEVADIVEMTPTKDAPLVPSTVVASFADVVARYGADYLVADGHYRQSIAEHLGARNLSLSPAPEGATGKADVYQATRTLLHEGRIRLPRHDRLLRQIREVVARPTAGGGVTIASPRWRTGGHGDLVSAFVLAVWDVARQDVPAAPRVVDDPLKAQGDAWETAIAEREEQARLEHERDQWVGRQLWGR